jgi:hypothetical protein
MRARLSLSLSLAVALAFAPDGSAQSTACARVRAVPPPAGPLFDDVHRMVPYRFTNTFGAAAGDVDGDGDVDVCTSNDVLLLNDGVGRLTESALPASLQEDFTWEVALGDVDGDGDLDAVLGRERDDKVLRNRGCGSFEELPNALARDFSRAGAVLLEDYDGDGDLDVFTANSFGGDRLSLNGGAGVFADASALLPPNFGSQTAVAGDFDSDGDPDLVVGATPQRYLRTEPTGFVEVAGSLPAHAYLTEAMASADVDRDGDLDLVLANSSISGPKRDLLWHNDGTGVFTDASARIPVITAPKYSLALGDVDGDGDADALLGGYGDHFLRNDGTGVLVEDATALPEVPFAGTNAPLLVDFDGDADADLFLGRGIFIGTQDRLYLNDGTGHFADVTHLEPLPLLADDRGEQAAWADVDGDGDLDALVANSPNFGGGDPVARNRLLRNDGAGSFADATEDLSTGAAWAYSVAAGDLDGDGDADVVLGNGGFFSMPADELLLNDGDGVFAPGSGLPAASDHTVALALSDLDGDGDLDLVLANDRSLANRLLLNDGAAHFTDASDRLAVRDDRTNSIAVGDVDADGDADLVLGNGGSDGTISLQNRLLLNDGSASLADGTARLPALLDDTRAVLLLDADGDADLDLYVANYFQPDELHRNDGTGVFARTLAGALPSETDPDRSAAAGDVDEDGDIDLVVASGTLPNRNKLLQNDGSGSYALRYDLLPARLEQTTHVSLADVDGDADLDLLYVNGSESTDDDGLEDQLYLNGTRQLAWLARPRVGKRTTLEITGRPREPWVLLMAAERGFHPLPPHGTLFLDPATARVVASGLSGADGRARFHAEFPDDPALIGTTVHWQAGIGPQKRLSNLEPTRLSGL